MSKYEITVEDGSVYEIETEDPKSFGQQFLEGQAQTIKNIGIEAMRGFANSASTFYKTLDGGVKLLEKVTGLKGMRGGIFEDWAEQTANYAEQLEKTELDTFHKTASQLVGGAIPLVTQFSLAPLKNPVQQFAVIGALEEAQKDPEFTNVIKGGLSGAANAAIFQSGGKIFNKAIDLLKSGKDAAITWLTFVTKNRKWSEDYINNIEKYNLNLKQKVPVASEIKEANTKKLSEIQNEYKLQTQYLDNKKTETLNNLRNEHKEVVNEMRLRNDALKTEYGTKKLVEKETLKGQKELAKSLQEQKIQATSEQTMNDLLMFKDKSDQSLQNQAVAIFDGAKQKYSLLRTEQGKAVASAIESAEKIGADKVPLSIVQRRINNAIKKTKGITLSQNNIKARTELNPKEFETINGWLQTMRDDTYAKDGTSLRYLNNLRDNFRIEAGNAYKNGDGTLGTLYSNLTDAINPVKIAESNKGTLGGLELLREANKGYAKLMPKYERAYNFFFTKVGEDYRPDPSKLISAIQNKNVSVLREMTFADSLLPKQDRIMPKVKNLITDAEESWAQQNSLVKNIKQQVNKEYEQTVKDFDKKLFVLSSEQQAVEKSINRNILKQTQETSSTQRKEMQKVMLEEKNKIVQFKNEYEKQKKELEVKLTELNDFYQGQERLRDFRAAPESMARLAQNIFGATTLGAAFNFNPLAFPAMAATSAFAPYVAATQSPKIIKISNFLKPGLSATQQVIKKTGIDKVISRQYKPSQIISGETND